MQSFRRQFLLKKSSQIAISVLLGIYVIAGLQTHLIFRNTNPEYDFAFYETALKKALSASDPYDVREIGPAFLYPPPALFVVESVNLLRNPIMRRWLLGGVNLAFLLLIILSVGKYFGYSVKMIWFWFPLAFFFAPAMQTVELGQINLVTEMGILLFFVSGSSIFAAIGWALGTVTKVTPAAFLVYSLVKRDIKTVFLSLIVLAFALAASIQHYGLQPHLTYLDVFAQLLDTYPVSQNSQSFASKILVNFSPDISPLLIQRMYMVYLGSLVLASSIISVRSRDAVPLFVVIGLATAVSPNVMWYHHYVFLLVPLFVWMGWRKLEQNLGLWIIIGLLVVQLDYYFLTTGLLIHLFVQCSILWIIFQQYEGLRKPLAEIRKP
ncbi:MAG: hypothetical protein Kow0070_20940 [Anaerolineales bacterium]